MRKMKTMIIISIVILAVIFLVVSFILYGNYQMGKISNLSYKETLNYVLKDNSNAVISVGIIKNGNADYTVYGENGTILPKEEHVYEIGSLTKTFTAALVEKAIVEEKININDTVDKYLAMPKGKKYPTIGQLLTHTSRYKGYYFETSMIGNFFCGRNDFCGINEDRMLARLSRLSVNGEASKFEYSNFGYATLGLILEAVYGEEYTKLVNHFAQEELGLMNTHISDRKGDLQNYWDWENDDVYLSAGGLTSNITDMLTYAQLQLSGGDIFTVCHESLAVINATSVNFAQMDIHMDEIGMGWIIDNKNEIIWHNGGTGGYNCYLGFNQKSDTAVVILSNLKPNYKIPATVMGIKLLLIYGTKE